ncbi:MAG: hypothetical protein Q7R30_22435 [Acidobacteriota bacterium]|nr:hypothetical protein [Acidobacteriota bacterium]
MSALSDLKKAGHVGEWVYKRMKAEWANRKQALCRNADKVYAKLKEKGAELPSQSKWDGLSCDQKMGFIAALGPYGTALLLAGALVGGFVTGAAAETAKYAKAAAKSIGVSGAAKSFADAVSGATSGVHVSVGGKKLFGLRLNGIANPQEMPAMRPTMDVDFGYLGNFGSVRTGGGSQTRGNLGGLGGPAGPGSGTGETSWSSYLPSFDQALKAYTTVTAKPTTAPRAPSPISVTSGGGRVAPQAGAALPSWALPAAGLLAVGGLVYVLVSKRR